MSNVNFNEINGFEIDVFNQYELPVGKSPTICPKCSETRKPENQKKKVLMVDWERGLGTCQHCGEVIQLHTFKRTREKEYVKPEWKNNTELSDNIVKWFESRRISQETLKKMKITEGKEFMPQEGKEMNTMQFNYFENGELINVKYRDGKKNFKLYKGAEKIFYNIDGIIGQETCIIVEGEIDALSFIESGVTNVVSVPNGANNGRVNLDYLDSCIDYFSDKTKIILALDNDEPGQNLKAEFIRRLGAEVCYILDFPECKDANEYLVRNNANSLRDLVHQAQPCPLENVLTADDVDEELRDFVQNGFKPGFQIGLNNFDEIFSTYTKQFISVTGIPSSGKSDFVDMMTVGYNQKYGWKTAYASPENKPTFLHVHKLMRKFGEWNPERHEIDSPKWKQIHSHVNDNFYFMEMDKYNLEAVLKKGAELVKRKGIKCLVIDPFNKVNAEGKNSLGVNDYTMKYLQMIDEFSRKYDVLTIIVAHPTKMYKGQDGKIEEPTMYNIKGGGEWYDASYHGLLVHRDYEAGTVKVKVLKVKFQNLGENGAEAYFKWDPVSGNYREHVQQNFPDLPFPTSFGHNNEVPF